MIRSESGLKNADAERTDWGSYKDTELTHVFGDAIGGTSVLSNSIGVIM